MNKKRQLIESILRLSDWFKEIWEKEFLKDYNITPLQFNILGAILWEKAETIQDIKNKIIVSSASLSQTLNRMEKKNLIKRVYGKWDRRYVNIWVTDEWKRLYKKLIKIYEKLIEEKLYFIDTDDVEKTIKTLMIIEKHLNPNK